MRDVYKRQHHSLTIKDNITITISFTSVPHVIEVNRLTLVPFMITCLFYNLTFLLLLKYNSNLQYIPVSYTHLDVYKRQA